MDQELFYTGLYDPATGLKDGKQYISHVCPVLNERDPHPRPDHFRTVLLPLDNPRCPYCEPEDEE